MRSMVDSLCPDLPAELGARVTAAHAVIARAGVAALALFEDVHALKVETKTGPQDLVSEADRRVETLIRRTIDDTFPDDGLVGEEHGLLEGTTDWTWIIDPIDGTAPFLHGLRSWSVVIALLHRGQPAAGLILDPCADRLYWAVAGHGAWEGRKTLRVAPAASLSDGLTAIGAGDRAQAALIGGLIARLIEAGGTYMRNGSAALSLAHVAAGHYIGFYEPRLSAWDCLAGLLIVTEAGGATDDWLSRGDLLARHPVLAATPGVAGRLRAIVAETAGKAPA